MEDERPHRSGLIKFSIAVAILGSTLYFAKYVGDLAIRERKRDHDSLPIELKKYDSNRDGNISYREVLDYQKRN